MKKIIAVLFTAVFFISAPVAVSARCYGNNAKNCGSSSGRYNCVNSTCVSCYCDEHSSHEICEVENCTEIGCHEHDGTYYFRRAVDSGLHSYEYCAVENCTVIGCHEHDGVYYFSNRTNKNSIANYGCGRAKRYKV